MAETCLSFLLFFLAAIQFSCKKVTDKTFSAVPCNFIDSSANTQRGSADVYIAGWRSFYPDNVAAVYWKNGTLINLTDGSRNITANSIAVSGNDVYVGGNEYINNHWAGKTWKNGVMSDITDISRDSYISCMTVSGNDIYTGGYENEGNHKLARYWKNGRAVTLTNGANDAEIESLQVAGNIVYASGWESNGAYNVAKYWLNGSPVILSNGLKNADAVSIAVYGCDVYVLEYEFISNSANLILFPESAKIYKNGAFVKSADLKSQAFNSIAISNNNLYVAGFDLNAACSFKNDSIQHLSDGTREADAFSIATWGSDIYVSGYEKIMGHNVATYWKNGHTNHISDGVNNAYALSIFLTRQ